MTDPVTTGCESAQNPRRVVPGAQPPRPGGTQGGSDALGSDSGAVLDARLIPAGRFRHPTVAVRVEGDPRGAWRCTTGAWLTTDEVADAERLIPGGSLRALAARWQHVADRCQEEGDVVMAAVFGQHADLIRELLGESPTSPNQQEGGDG